MRRMQLPALFVGAALLAGCSTLPKFDTPLSQEKVGPKVSDVVNEVQCEILLAVDDSKGAQQAELEGLQDEGAQYVANVNLTLDVTDNQGINPALSFIQPYSLAPDNFTGALSGQISGQQHRSFNVTFTLVFDRNTPTEDNLQKCRTAARGSGLKGNLGIEEVIATGLRYETGHRSQGQSPYMMPAVEIGASLASAAPLAAGAGVAPNFGSTIDFTLIYGLSGGPNWTLTHFNGSDPSGRFLSLMRTDKDTLVISFARVPQPPPQAAGVPAAKEAATEAAAKAAQDDSTRMILQRLLPP